jgi:hypothetical protein
LHVVVVFNVVVVVSCEGMRMLPCSVDALVCFLIALVVLLCEALLLSSCQLHQERDVEWQDSEDAGVHGACILGCSLAQELHGVCQFMHGIEVKRQTCSR